MDEGKHRAIHLVAQHPNTVGIEVETTVRVCNFGSQLNVATKRNCKMKRCRTERSSQNRANNPLKEEWAAFFSKATKQSRKQKRKIARMRKANDNKDRLKEEQEIQEWHKLCHKRNDSTSDLHEFNAVAIDPPEGAWETLDILNR